MGTFSYRGRYGDRLSGVCCDACGFRLYTDTEGQCFGEHMKDAKNAGWLIVKESGKWVNLCPECKAEKERRKRNEYFNRVEDSRRMIWHRTDKFERGGSVVIVHQSDFTEYTIETRQHMGGRVVIYMVCLNDKDVKPFYTFKEAKRFVQEVEG